MSTIKTLGRRNKPDSPFIYKDYLDNHVIWPGRESKLKEYLGQTFKNINHKRKNAYSSHSEDALTWSCFDTLRNVDKTRRAQALTELWELAFDTEMPKGFEASNILIGEKYGHGREETEVDLSFEADGFLVFVEAKLYSPMSQADLANNKPHNQIARKLSIGLREARKKRREFYFILLDVAPPHCLLQIHPHASLAKAMQKQSGFGGKWLTAYWFNRYKHGGKLLTPLRELLLKEGFDLNLVEINQVADHMGWLTWPDVFKVVLRAVIH